MPFPPEQSRNKPIPLWLDVDTGHDDAFALLLAACHPDLHLLGVSTTYGNASLAHTTYNTRAVLKALGRERDVRVWPGAAKPKWREVCAAEEIHGESGLDGTVGLPVPKMGGDVEGEGGGDGVGVMMDAMAEALMATEKGSAWIVATGALTNVAMVFATHPELVEHIAGLSVMGGAIGGGFSGGAAARVMDSNGNGDCDGDGGVEGGNVGGRIGNWTRYAEFNIYIDPESAKAVLEENLPLARKTTLVTLDVTHQFLATEAVRTGLRDGFDKASGGGDGAAQRTKIKKADEEERLSPIRPLFLSILTYFTQTYAQHFALTAGPPLHDPLAVAAVLMPDAFSDWGGERWNLQVVTEGVHGPKGKEGVEGSQCGRTVARRVEGDGGGARIPRGLVDEGRGVWRVLEECLGRAERAVGGR